MSRRIVLGLALVACACGKPAPAPSTTPASAAPPAAVAPPPADAATSTCPSGMAAAPAGSFTLGKTKAPVTVAAHCIDRTEVTVSAYARCVEKGACSAPDAHDEDHEWCNWKRAGREEHPINCVDQAQAIAYCAFVSARLPTEAEWEWSARGYERGTRFPWGDEEPGARACWDGPGNTVPDDREGTCPVGSFEAGANPAGVLDLAGNVWEWTATDSGGKAIDKGGGYPNAVASRLVAADRNQVVKTERYSTLGFRCVR